MIVDELILKLQADLSDVKKGLAQVQADAGKAGKAAGEEMGKAAGTSFKDVFQAIVGAALLNKVTGFFSAAVDSANKLEASLSRVESAARAFGQSTVKAKEAAQDLAQDGFLSLNQSASSLSNLMATGLNVEQSKKFITASKDIAAFGNTIGDAAESIESGIKGILTGSSELVENMSPKMKSLSMRFTENKNKVGEAKAAQMLYNDVLKLGNQFAGDAAKYLDTAAAAQKRFEAETEKASATIGQKLQPAYKSLFNIGTSIVSVFVKIIDSLGSVTVSMGALSAVVAVAGLVLVKLGAAIGLSFTAALGPIGLILAGVGLVTAAIVELNRRTTGDYLAEQFRKGGKELKELTERAKELDAQNKRSAAQEQELLKIRDKLRDKAKELGQDYDKLAKTYKNAGDMAQYLADAEKNISREKAAKKLTEELGELTQEKNDRAAGRGTFKRGVKAAYSVGISELLRDSDSELAAKEQQKIQAIAKLYQPETAEQLKTAASSSPGTKRNEARFIESQKKLAEIEANRAYTVLLAKGDKKKIADAEEDARQQARAETGAMRQVFAEYIEDKALAESLALRKSTDDAIRAVKELENANGITKKEAEEKIQKIREANVRKEAQIRLQSYADTLSAANATTTGFSQIVKSKDAGSALGGVSGTLGGLSKLSPKLSALGPLGTALGAGVGIVSTLSDLFGKSDEERKKEAAEQARRDEEAKKILELQANYQKDMLALQEAAAKTPFENLQRNLRLIDIQAQQSKLAGVDEATVNSQRLAARQGAIQGTLTEQGGVIAQGSLFGDVQATPESLIAFLNKRGEQALAIAQFNALIQSTSDPNMSFARMQEIYALAQSYSGKVPDALYSSGLNGLKKVSDFLNPANTSRSDIEFNSAIAALGESRNIAAGLNSEITSDTSRAESLLSVIQDSYQVELDIRDASKKTAENTAKALELRPDRERSFIDLGLGIIQSLGQKVLSPTAVSIAQNLASQNFTVPTEIGSATAVSSRARTLQERMADSLEKQVALGMTANDILRDMRAALVELIAVTDGNAGTTSSFGLQQFTEFQAEANRRRV